MKSVLEKHRRVQNRIADSRAPIIQKVIEFGVNNIQSDYELNKELDKQEIDKENYINRFKNTHSIDERSQTIKKSGYTVPGFKYLGPGNTLNLGKPVNEIDEDAKEHDIAYNEAISYKEIEDADTKFISKAGDHIAEGIAGRGSIKNSIGGTLGAVGISIKKAVENKFGPIYPSFSGKQCHLQNIALLILRTRKDLKMLIHLGLKILINNDPIYFIP